MKATAMLATGASHHNPLEASVAHIVETGGAPATPLAGAILFVIGLLAITLMVVRTIKGGRDG